MTIITRIIECIPNTKGNSFPVNIKFDTDDSEKLRVYTQISGRNIVGYTMLTHDDNAHARHIEAAEVCIQCDSDENPQIWSAAIYATKKSMSFRKEEISPVERQIYDFYSKRKRAEEKKNKPKTAWANVGR